MMEYFLHFYRIMYSKIHGLTLNLNFYWLQISKMKNIEVKKKSYFVYIKTDIFFIYIYLFNN